MALRTFDFCALAFLNQWLEKEAECCEALASNDIETQRKALIVAGGHFRVARNLPVKYETAKNLSRYQPVLDVLNDLSPVSTENVAKVVCDAQQRISSAYGDRKTLSLTTKFLWLKVRNPIRIYDSQARIALGTAPGDFPAFNSAFSNCFIRFHEQIELACANLIKVMSYSVRPSLDDSDLNSLVSTKWFQERVLDIYLWHQGSV